MLYSEFCFDIINFLNSNESIKEYILIECCKEKPFDFSLFNLLSDDIKNKLNDNTLKLFYYLMLYKCYYNNYGKIILDSSNINKIKFKKFLNTELKPYIYEAPNNGIISLTINYIENKQIRKLINRNKLDFNIIETNEESVSPITNLKQTIIDLNEIVCYLTKNLIVS